MRILFSLLLTISLLANVGCLVWGIGIQSKIQDLENAVVMAQEAYEEATRTLQNATSQLRDTKKLLAASRSIELDLKQQIDGYELEISELRKTADYAERASRTFN